MVDLLPFLPGWPPGAMLLLSGLACALLRSQALARFGLPAIALEVARLEGGGLEVVGALCVAVVVGLVAVAGAERGRSGVGAASGLALAAAGAALAALHQDHLGWVGPLLLLGGALERGATPAAAAGRDPATGASTADPRSWRWAGASAVLSAALIGAGAWLRREGDGGMAVEWVGTPFAGDLPSTLLFIGLALPIALPPQLGGVTQALAAGPTAGGAGAFAMAGLGRGLALLVLLGRTFAGSDALLNVGVAMAALAPLLALLGGGTAARLLALGVYGILGGLLAVAAIPSEAVAAAVGQGTLGLAVAGTGAALGLRLATEARLAEPGLGERGLGHVFPGAFGFTLLCLLGMLAVPGTLPFEALSTGLAAMAEDGAAAEAVLLAALAGPLFVFVGVPFLRATFFSAGEPGGAKGSRRRTAPRGLVLALGLAAAALVGLGQAPSILDPVAAPLGGAGARLLTPAQQLQVLLGAALLARIVRR